jgi:hypothetical protein
MSARPHADAPNRNRPHKRLPWVVAATATALLVGTFNPATGYASEHTTPEAAISAHSHDLAGNQVHADGRTARTTTTPAVAPKASTGHVMLTGCIPGMNC